MTNPTGDVPPGWYPAAGDPPGTQRFWDGRQWVGGPMPAQPPPGYGAYRSRDDLPEIGRTLAGPWHRIAARIIDGLIVGVISTVVLLVLFSDDITDAAGFDEFDGTVLLVSLLAVAWEVAWVALRGATPGKLAMGIAVSTQRGVSPPGWGPAVLRSLLDLFALLPVVGLLVGLLEIASLVLLFADDRRRTIPDRIASTYVVKTR